MTSPKRVDIANMRLYNQGISGDSNFKSPSEVVSWFGAMQAQDYQGSKWSIALRMKNATDKDIEEAISDKSIIRTWALRGTLHFVTPKDIYWILDLVAPKIIKSIATRYKQMELDTKLLAKSNNIISKAVSGNHALTRPEIKELLSKNKIPTHDLRLNFIIQRAAFDKLICLGPRRNKEFTFVSLEEWAALTKPVEREESISELANRFFKSHGPANVQDFAWWSGLTLSECRVAIDCNKAHLLHEMIEGIEYWYSSKMPVVKSKSIFLLPGFDEYMLGYKDRGAMIEDQHVKHVFASGNAIFKNIIIEGGRVVGTWRRTFIKNEVLVEPFLFSSLTKTKQTELLNEVSRFGKYLDKKAELV